MWTVPLVVLFTMSVLTDINLGLRIVLAVLPYVFIAAGKVVPWIKGMTGLKQKVASSIAGGSLALTIAATVSIRTHYLPYFNWASGGPDRVPARLIDSNLDWGQDLVGLQQWWKRTIPDQPLGLVYFGQINPSIFTMRGEPFRWFLPPPRPGTMVPTGPSSAALGGPASRIVPGYYAVSVTALYWAPLAILRSRSESAHACLERRLTRRLQLLPAIAAGRLDRTLDQHLSRERGRRGKAQC